MRGQGITFDTGFFSAGTSTREPFDAEIVRREMRIIRDDLHCNAVRVTGGDPDRLDIAATHAANAGLDAVLSTEGMLCVRRRKPTSGAVSKKLSNHSWGTAVDFNIVGFAAPGNTKQNVPKFIATMVPFFNKEGWLSGIAFNDSMHFEVADETIKKWSKDGKLV